MSKDVLDIKAEMAAELARIKQTVSALSGNRISIKDKLFKLPSGETSEGPMTVVIVDYVTQHMMYQGKYNAKNPTPPICFAIGKEIASLVPSANSPNPQHGDCVTCPMNQFGSDGSAKACKNTRLLAVLAPNNKEESPIMTLSVPPTSLKKFDKYVTDIVRRFSTTPIGVVTEIGFDPDSGHERLTFAPVGPNEHLKTHWGRKAEALEILVTEPDMSRVKAAAAQPAARGRRAA